MWVDACVQANSHHVYTWCPCRHTQVLGDLQELGVELLAVSGDPRERAESFVRPFQFLNCIA